MGACTNPNRAPATACGDPSDTDCDDPDTCDGAGNCDDNYVPPGTACTDDGNVCTDDVCDGTGACIGTYQVRLFGDIVPSFCPPICPQPDVDDITCLLDDFGDGPSVDGCDGSVSSTDLAPCGGDGTLDLDDILAILDAFAQIYACPHPCP